MWKNIAKPDMPQMAAQYDSETMRFPCRITKERIQTHTHNV